MTDQVLLSISGLQFMEDVPISLFIKLIASIENFKAKSVVF